MTLFDIEVIGKSKMGAIAFICTAVPAAIFNKPLTSMTESIRTSPTELLDPEIVGVA